MKMRGFTLMEMVMTIVIGSIITLGITSFIRIGMTGYADTIQRQRLQSQAQFVIEKMSREIRHAVPNSFHVPDADGASKCLEFVPIKYSGFYAVSNNELQFLVANDVTLAQIKTDNWMVINPSRYQDLFPSEESETEISQRINLINTRREDVGEPFSISHSPDTVNSNSISNRHYIYGDNSQVSYCFEDDHVLRNGTVVADSVVTAASSMNYEQATLHRGGLVHINLVFEQDGERSVYQHDVQVLNVP